MAHVECCGNTPFVVRLSSLLLLKPVAALVAKPPFRERREYELRVKFVVTPINLLQARYVKHERTASVLYTGKCKRRCSL